MDIITVKEIKEMTNGTFINMTLNYKIDNVSIDSRSVNKKSLFIPIIGENHDGHTFLEDAYNNGCRTFLIDKNHTFNKNDANIIMVDDTTKGFGMIAKAYKERYNPFIVSVTGSVGKTSTRDIIYSVLKMQYKTLKNEGNLNNNIGIPKTLLNLDKSYKMAVIEMGMNHKGEISYLTDIVNPNMAVISNIGMSHIENLGSMENIFNAKMEITKNFNLNNVLFVNGDDPYLKRVKDRHPLYRVYTYGFNKGNDIYCTNYVIEKDHIDFTVVFNYTEEYFTIPSIAKHNIYNAMAAILVGRMLDIPMPKIKEGLKNFTITKGRLTIIEKNYLTIIDDTYNASLDSVSSALDVLKSFKNRKVAILGDVLEAGSYSSEIHKKIGTYAKDKCNFLVGVGENSKIMINEAINNGFNKDNTRWYNTYDELIKDIDTLIKYQDVVLIKASHGISLDKVTEYLDKKYE